MNESQIRPETDAVEEPPSRGGAVVTGAGDGVGLRLAQVLVERGHPVHLTDLDGARAARAAGELGAPHFGSALDVRSLTACKAAAARTRRRVGSFSVWINSAIIPTEQAAWELDERARQRILEVNLAGTMNGTLAALEAMRASEGGAVINVIPLSGLLPLAGQALMAAGSQGALAFSLATRADLVRQGADSVHVSCLCVGRAAQVPDALGQLLDHPRPVLAAPPWRGTMVRAAYLWPKLAPLGSRLAAGWPGRQSGSSRRPRRRR